PAAENRLLREPELARDPQAALVLGVDLDVDPVEAALLDPGSRQHGRHLRGEPLPDRAGADEVADLERPLAAAPVKPGASDLTRLVWGEHTVRVVLVRVEARAKAAEKLDLLVERLRLEPRPRHPGPQVVDARVDRLLEQRRILGVVAADDEALALDPIGGVVTVTPTRSSRAAST